MKKVRKVVRYMVYLAVALLIARYHNFYNAYADFHFLNFSELEQSITLRNQKEVVGFEETQHGIFEHSATPNVKDKSVEVEYFYTVSYGLNLKYAYITNTVQGIQMHIPKASMLRSELSYHIVKKADDVSESQVAELMAEYHNALDKDYVHRADNLEKAFENAKQELMFNSKINTTFQILGEK